MPLSDASRPAQVAFAKSPAGPSILSLSGRLDAEQTGRLWKKALSLARDARGNPLVVDLARLDGCDIAGATMIRAIMREYGAGRVAVENAPTSVAALLDLARSAVGDVDDVASAKVKAPPKSTGAAGAASAIGAVAFLGEAIAATLRAPWRMRVLRAGEIWRIADQAGVRAVPLVLLLGLLMGLILSFQSLIPLRRFGAELYVANLVGISLTRELGPLLTAVILAGRTGSAFAAELGTMQVNEEIDAVRTMGLDPMTLLVLPRLAAAALVMPALTILLEIAGLAGMAIVLDGFGFPPVAVANQLVAAVKLRDLWGGLFKAVVFGCVIAAIGCRSGLATGKGPRAVGLSATSAVVGGIVATILLDGMFALLFFRIGI